MRGITGHEEECVDFIIQHFLSGDVRLDVFRLKNPRVQPEGLENDSVRNRRISLISASAGITSMLVRTVMESSFQKRITQVPATL